MATKPVEQLDRVVIRFAGDSGDGMQLAGSRFTSETALLGNDLSTFPDFPAEIRAPAGSLPGVSGYQIHFSSKEIMTPGDRPQVLVAFNPAALKANIKDLVPGGTIIVNTDTFNEKNFVKANIDVNPLENGSLKDFRVIPVAMNKLTDKALAGLNMSPAQVGRCKNFFALGIMYWMYERKLDPTIDWIKKKFKKVPLSVESNTKA